MEKRKLVADLFYTFYTRYTIYYMLYTIYYILYTICYMLYAIYYILYTTSYVLHTICLFYTLYAIGRGPPRPRVLRGAGRLHAAREAVVDVVVMNIHIYIYITFHCLSSFVGITICPSNIKSSSRCTQGRAVRSCPRSRSRRQRSTTGGGGKRRATKTHAI